MANSLLAMGRHLGKELYTKLLKAAEAEAPITGPDLASASPLAWGSHSKGESMENFPAFLFDLASDHDCELKHLHCTVVAPCWRISAAHSRIHPD